MFAGSLPGVSNQGNANIRREMQWLEPAILSKHTPYVDVPVKPGRLLVMALGTVIGLQTADAADVQTISVSGGAGTFTIFNPLGSPITVAYNVPTNAGGGNLQSLLQAIYGTGNILVTGAAGTSYVITGAGDLGKGQLPLLVVTGAGGCTATIAHTTVGTEAGAAAPYSGALQAAPAAAPTMTDSAGAGTWPAGSYTGCYTYVNANGETTPSPMTAYASAGTKKIHFATINTIPTGVTKLNYYVDGQFVVQKNVVTASVAAFDVDLADIAAGVPLHVPNANTAFTALDGTATPVGLMVEPCFTDLFGNLFFGTVLEPVAAGQGKAARMAIQGYFRSENLNVGGVAGIDANALSKLNGRLINGSVSNGLIYIGG